MKDKGTSEENKSDTYVGYTKLSLARMKRILTTTILSEEVESAIAAIKKQISLMVLNESWCGDAA